MWCVVSCVYDESLWLHINFHAFITNKIVRNSKTIDFFYAWSSLITFVSFLFNSHLLLTTAYTENMISELSHLRCLLRVTGLGQLVGIGPEFDLPRIYVETTVSVYSLTVVLSKQMS